eukprot:CAMPEP_0170240540 /NCGR_PEP_ID=MMETSP0116_2-20130129/20029_1 /TAXON_ID=400756 /ORGANISM="Durinskia baltica, Strain CSIRO CS-38" /LENGTH=494 /DNA_ID=CAMNT_0010491361 /DNA_START=53 /DNA_END=1534 /DNA_ORIENTATION=-
MKAIQLREKGLSKTEIAEKIGRSEHFVKRWWREHPAMLERPAGANDVVLKRASLSSFRDLDIRRGFLDDDTVYDTLLEKVQWRPAKVVARDRNTGELALRYDERGRSINAGRQVADYAGGLDVLDKVLQKAFSEMDIRDPQARIFMNYYANGQERVGVHRHDFWTCLISFGAPRILTMDGRPILMRDRDLVVFGTQNHGVPQMPDTSGGRISLVIFFYPDADNLERRQWQTIAADNEEEGAEGKVVPSDNFEVRGVDHGFQPTLLFGEAVSRPKKTTGPQSEVFFRPSCGSADECCCEESALSKALDPGVERRGLFKSPNSQLNFADGGSSGSRAAPTPAVTVPTVFTVGCDGSQEERQFFATLQKHGVASIWDLRGRPPRDGWAEPETLRRTCAIRAVKYRHYPIGRREAGGIAGHIEAEEGHDVFKRFLAVADAEVAAIVGAEMSWRQPEGLRGLAAELLVGGGLGLRARVLHLPPDGGEAEEHPRRAAGAP